MAKEGPTPSANEVATHFQVCAVELGSSPNSSAVRVVYDDCVALKGARGLRDMLQEHKRYQGDLVFIRKVDTVVTLEIVQ